ncbi:MAG TPA: hypothetical protein PK580_01555, partial [Nitrosomonas halophila]|nr:hypothetical protein [Nitrosomonas halophila]
RKNSAYRYFAAIAKSDFWQWPESCARSRRHEKVHEGGRQAAMRVDRCGLIDAVLSKPTRSRYAADSI